MTLMLKIPIRTTVLSVLCFRKLWCRLQNN